jgi:hypothetical protein
MATKKAAGTTVAKMGGTALVAYKEKLAALAQKSKAIASSMDSGEWITMRGGKFKYQGNPIKGNTFDAVVVDYCLENALYEGKFEPDSPKSPICFAFGLDAKTMVPSPASEKKQCESCLECEHNKFGTAETGRGKACKNINRLALMHVDSLKNGTDGIMGAVMPKMKLPVTSGKGWSGYVNQLANVKGLPPLGVVTRFAIQDDDDDQFHVTFELVRDVTEEEGAALLERVTEAEAALTRPYQAMSEAPAGKGKPAAKAPAKKGTGKKY